MSRIKQGLVTVLNSVHANGAGAPLDVSEYKNMTFQVFTTGSFTGTIKFAVSMSLVAPDFTANPSITNVYDFIEITPVNTGTPLAGSTGIAIAGTDIIKMYTITVSEYTKWICPIVSGYSGTGHATCQLDAVNNTSRG